MTEMSSPTQRETFGHSFAVWNRLVLPTIKASDVFSVFLKATVAVFTIATTSLFFYLAFSNRADLFSCPDCETLRISAQQRRASASPSPSAGAGHFTTAPLEETTVSHILFGIGGSAKTWQERCRYSVLWWKPGVTRGFVWLDEKPPENQTWPETSPPYRVSADTSAFNYTCWYGSRSAIRIARIVKESFELGVDGVRWFVMADDDTVFFVENLVSVLGKYDHNQLYYIGGNSESVEQDVIHSYKMGYGGAGFAISYALAVELVRVLDGCINRYPEYYGSDQKIGACISEIGVPFTREPGFHQVDIRGNPYGLLAAHPVAPLVSLHHLDYVQSLFPDMSQVDSLKMLMSAYNADPFRTLQQSFCYDLKHNWSVSVSWGYTVQLYPWLVRAKELETPIQTFLSWRSWSDGPFAFNTRIATQDPCGRPLLYFLHGVEQAPQGRTLTTYTRYAEEDKECDQPRYGSALALRSFKVSASVLPRHSWRKDLAPRRQCCDVLDRKDGGVVAIRSCNKFESVTPH